MDCVSGIQPSSNVFLCLQTSQAALISEEVAAHHSSLADITKQVLPVLLITKSWCVQGTCI